MNMASGVVIGCRSLWRAVEAWWTAVENEVDRHSVLCGSLIVALDVWRRLFTLMCRIAGHVRTGDAINWVLDSRCAANARAV